MSNLDDIRQYTVPLDKGQFNIIEQNLAQYDNPHEYLDRVLLYLDCTRLYPNGMRAMQTVGYPYRHEISVYLHVLNLIEDEAIKKEYEDKLIERHDANIAYESEHGTIWYDKQKKNKWGVKKPKEKKEKVPRIPASVVKAAKKAAKLQGLKFNIVKPDGAVQEK